VEHQDPNEADVPEASKEATLRQVARAALRAYDLPPDLSVRPIRLLNNAVFEVLGGGVHLVLRVHRPGYRSVGHVRSELRVLEALAADLRGSSVAVPAPVPARDGSAMVRVGVDGEGEAGLPRRDCDLLTWIEGRALKHGRGLGARSTFLLGEGLGRLHNAAQQLGDDLDLPRWDAETMFSHASPFRPGRMEEFLAPEALGVFEDVAARARTVFEQLGQGEDQWGIIHNDYILINCHFSRERGGWNLGVLDFDDLGRGYFLYDLAPLLGNLFDWPYAYGRLRQAFLDGYRSVRALPPDLERHLPVLMAARHAASLTWLAAKQRRGEADVPIERHVEIRVSEMKRCLALGAK
jgi:Ser/Thr protein kinase RdoA (MazF antagonist)